MKITKLKNSSQLHEDHYKEQPDEPNTQDSQTASKLLTKQ
jgi:hypothetical protein